MRQLRLAGYTCTHDSAQPEGEIAVINTCGFIGDAKEESINTILQFAKRKTEGKLKKLFVMGCLAERYMKDLEQELPEVDKFYGKFDFKNLLSDLGKVYRQDYDIERVITTPSHYAYLKIAEGCNRFCSYCAIPLITGRYRSRSIEDIVKETKWLVGQGVKEFQVIAQDLTYYGQDLYGENRLAELLKRLSDIKGVEWLRLHYAYPTHFPTQILPVMRERDNICKYLDIALQHISDRMLKLMRRHITKQETCDLISLLRSEVPDIHIRTTMLLGHPGETESDVEELLEFVEQTRFERLGAFAYSNEEGTYAFLHYNDDIPFEVKQNRVDRLMSLQEQIATEINSQKKGRRMKVIIDRLEGDYFIGRTEFDSPEVDGEVLLNKNLPLQIGEFYDVLITDTDTYDLYATL
jgi:ribosomal protein S12 methylthiotransferase